ncbi:MAG: hypothetical protein AABX70_02615 [Nanoarchaeota archaeon]
MKNIVGILTLSIVLLIGIQAVSAFQLNYGFPVAHPLMYGSERVPGISVPIQPLTPYHDPTVRSGGFFGNSNLYLAGLRAGDLQEPYPGMKYSQRLQLASEYYPRYPIGWIREGGYWGERGINLKGTPGAPGTYVFGASKGRGSVFSGFN